MTIPVAVLMKLATLGLPADAAEAVASMLSDVEAATRAEADAAAETSREKGRERWRRWDEKRRANGSQRLQTLANNSRGGVAPVEDKTSTTVKEPQKKEEKKARATRLSPDWVLPPEWKAEAVAEGMSPIEAERQGMAMRNWSLSAPGGAKLDWHATWLNWFRRRLDERPPAHAHGTPPPRAGNAVIDLASRLITQMDQADANSPAQAQGNSASSLRLPRYHEG